MPAHKKTKPYSILRDDNSLLTYNLTTDDIECIWNAMDSGKVFARTSIGFLKVGDIRHIIEYIPPKPRETDAPAIPIFEMDDDQLRDVLQIHYADHDTEEVRQWLRQLETRDELVNAALVASGSPVL